MKKHRIPEAIAFFAPLALYTATLAPTIHLGDSGELTVAAALLGVPHVPGYPLLTTLGHLLAQLPLSHIAWRGNFSSALFGALACWATYRLLLAITGRRLAALAAALTLATSFTLWEQSLKVRAYPLNTFFAAATLYYAVRWRQTWDKRFLFTACLVLGIGLANHEILLVTAAVPGVLMLAHRDKLRWTDWLIAGVAGAVGVSIYLYLPLRAVNHPALNWGDPSTPTRLLDALLQRQYAFKMGTADWAAKWDMVLVIARSFLDEMGLVAFFLGAAGVVALAKKQRALVLGFVLLIVGNIALRINYIGEDEIFQVRRYLISSYLVVAIGLAYVLAWFQDRVHEPGARPWLRPALGVLMCLIVAWPALHNLPANRQQDNWVAYEAWQNVLSHPEPTYAVFVGGDNNIFPLWYLQLAERRRPTVTPLPRVGFRADWMVAMMAPGLPPNVIQPHPVFGRDVYRDPLFLSTAANLLQNTSMPFAFVFDNLAAPLDDQALTTLRGQTAPQYAGALTWWQNPQAGNCRPLETPDQPADVLGALVAGASSKNDPECERQRAWRFYQTTAITDPLMPRDHHTGTVATDYGAFFNRLALDRERENEPNQAVRAFQHAIMADPENDAAMANLGNLLARTGDLVSAVQWYQRALAAQPDEWRHHHNLSLILEAAGQPDTAATHRARADALRGE
jgi:Protein O-mannosyl-transferase TMEM260-like/Tetratricopeptide repeat